MLAIMWQVGCFLLWTATQILPGNQEIKNPFNSLSDQEAGGKMFRSHCAVCHGRDGTGGRGPDLTRGEFRYGGSDAALLQTISFGIPGTEMPGVFFSENQVWKLVAFVRSLSRRSVREEIPGDAAAGEAVYRNEGNCSQCHMIGGFGGRLGPDLTDIGSLRNPEHLRRSLLRPSQDLSSKYWTFTVRLRNGEILRGLRLNEDTHSIQMMDVNETLHSFWKRDVGEVKGERISLMPSYEGILEARQLEDLVAFLYTLRRKGP